MINELVLDEFYEGLDFFEDEVIQVNNEKKERFRIESLEQANWALRKIRATNIKADEIEVLANIEIERINTWKSRELEAIKQSIAFFEGLIFEYYAKQKKLDPKFKISTPYGKVTSKKQQDKWNYEDEKVIESLKGKGIVHLIRTKEIVEVEKAELKKTVEVLQNVVSLNGEVKPNIKPYDEDGVLFINTETGEIEDLLNYEYHKQVIVYQGKIIEGITVEKRPDSIIIKAEV